MGKGGRKCHSGGGDLHGTESEEGSYRPRGWGAGSEGKKTHSPCKGFGAEGPSELRMGEVSRWACWEGARAEGMVWAEVGGIGLHHGLSNPCRTLTE